MRRKAPLHFEAKAENAHFTAFVLWSLIQTDLNNFKSELGYSGTPGVALGESFGREASLALELIIKAVIAARIEKNCGKLGQKSVRATHDLLHLWNDAELPKLSKNDQFILLRAKQILFWAGRYAAPLHDKNFEMEQEQFNNLRKPQLTEGQLKVRVMQDSKFDWENFHRIYCIANDSLWTILSANHA